MGTVGLFDKVSRFGRAPARRPKGGTRSRDAYVPPVPEPAAGEAPPSPAESLSLAGVAPPRPMVWAGTAASGTAVWTSPVANGAGQALWAELREAAGSAGVWPVLTGPSPVPSSWRLTSAQRPGEVVVPDAEPLLEAALARQDTPEKGFRTRLEPSQRAVVEADLAAGYVALLTGIDGWQVPIAVGFEGVGGWSATEHAAVLRLWGLRYKAELVSLTDSGVGVRVGRPPASHEAAMEAAESIYAYCPDVVTRGVGSMWALATTIAVSGAWSLRWSP